MAVLPVTGTRLLGRYEILEAAAEGGMASVFRARDHQSGEVVAVKMMHPQLADDPIVERRFLREARVGRQLRHPHVVPVIDHHAGTPDRLPFMVQPWVNGGDLQGWVQDLPYPVFITLVVDVLEGLAYCHAQGVLHRDLKLGNVLIEARSDGTLRARVCDFGIAAALDEVEGQLQGHETTVGTPLYMAPEQCMNIGALTPAADLYSVAAILYRVASGHYPFEGSVAEVLRAKTRQTAPPLRPARTDVPKALVAIVERALARNPWRRYRHAAELAEDLRPHGAPARRDPGWFVSRPPGRSLELVPPVEEPAARPSERVRELRWLSTRVQRAAGGEGGMVVLQGPRGVGKAALLRALTSRLVEGGGAELVTCDYARGRGLRRGILRYLGIADRGEHGLTHALRALLLARGVDDLDEVKALAGELSEAQATGVELPTARRLLWFLRLLARRRPLVLWIEDLEAAEELWGFLEYLLARQLHIKMGILVVTSLRGLSERQLRPGLRKLWAFQGRNLAVVRLKPLSERACAQSVRARAPEVSMETALAAARLAGGVTDLALLLARQGAVDGDRAAAVVLRPLDRLVAEHPRGSELSAVVRAVAVLGSPAELPAVEELIAQTDLAPLVDELIGAGILGDVRGEWDQVGFAHPLLERAVLERMRPAIREGLQRRLVARWAKRTDAEARLHRGLLLADLGDPEAVRVLMALSDAGTGGPSDIRAARRLLQLVPAQGEVAGRVGPRLGRWLLDQGELDQAEALGRGFFGHQSVQVRAEALALVARVSLARGHTGPARELLWRASGEVAAAGGEGAIPRSALQWLYCDLALVAEESEECSALDPHLADVIAHPESPEQQQEALLRGGQLSLRQGHLDVAEERFREALRLLGPDGLARPRVAAYRGLAAVAARSERQGGGRRQEALRLLGDAADVCREAELGRQLAEVLIEQGDCWCEELRPERARERYESAGQVAALRELPALGLLAESLALSTRLEVGEVPDAGAIADQLRERAQGLGRFGLVQQISVLSAWAELHTAFASTALGSHRGPLLPRVMDLLSAAGAVDVWPPRRELALAALEVSRFLGGEGRFERASSLGRFGSGVLTGQFADRRGRSIGELLALQAVDVGSEELDPELEELSLEALTPIGDLDEPS